MKSTHPQVFDYEKKVWGATVVKPLPWYIQGLKLKYCLADLLSINGKVLDIGCGAGNMAKAIKVARPDLDVHGVDVSKAAIAVATKSSGGVSFHLGAVEKLPFKSGTFDAVVMFDVLEHVEDTHKALSEVRRVLKRNGVFHLFMPLDGQPGTLYSLLYKVGWQPKNKHTGHIRVYSDSDMMNMFAKADFRLTTKRFSFHWVFSFFDVVYFSLLEIMHLHAPSSIEGMIKQNRLNPLVMLFNLFYRLVIIVGYYESVVFRTVPAGGGHYLLVKN